MTAPRDVWIVAWTYSPANYCEGSVKVHSEDYDLTIEDGKASATTIRDPRPGLCNRLDAELKCRFQGIQLVSHKSFELSPPSVSCRHAGGKETIFLRGASAIKLSDHADLTITNKNGKVVGDTRAERIERKQFLGDLAAKNGVSDPVAGQMLGSYCKAINDYDNFLIYLYEIMDALRRRFEGEDKATRQLKISRTRWETLGRLACAEPLKQGRHRGWTKPSELRDATQEELDIAMSIAAEMVEKYLKHLDIGTAQE